MAKINDTTTFPITAPAVDDFMPGTDVSDTGNSADGETVSFKIGDILDLAALSNTWHPYDRTTVAGSQDGNIYDSAVDGTVASIESPAFEAGYEYMFYFEQVTGSSGATLQAQMYWDASAAYESLFSFTGVTVTAGQGIWGSVIIPRPKVSHSVHEAITSIRIDQSIGGGDNVLVDKSYRVSVPWTVGKVKFAWAAGSFNGGKVFMYRRREGISA